MPDYQQTGSSSNTEAAPPISPSLFHGFDANNASISLRVEDELVSTEMPDRTVQISRNTINDSENGQAEVILSSSVASDGTTNQPGNITKDRKNVKNVRSASNSRNKYDKSKTKKRGRHGHLAPDAAKNAHEMRRLRACMLCSLEKVTVSLNQRIIMRGWVVTDVFEVLRWSSV
jgi:hypothetical protein